MRNALSIWIQMIKTIPLLWFKGRRNFRIAAVSPNDVTHTHSRQEGATLKNKFAQAHPLANSRLYRRILHDVHIHIRIHIHTATWCATPAAASVTLLSYRNAMRKPPPRRMRARPSNIASTTTQRQRLPACSLRLSHLDAACTSWKFNR